MIRKMFIALTLLVSLPAFGATCKISEYQAVTRDDFNNVVMTANEPAVATQEVTFTVSSVQSALFNSRTAFVRIVCDAKAHFVFGTDPTATAVAPYLPTDVPEYFGVPASNPSSYRVAIFPGT